MNRSPLHDLHVELNARFVDFGGWDMPVQYQSVLDEHRAVRTGCGWFDVSHLGRFAWEGPGALAVLQALLSNDAALIEPGRTQYTLLLNEVGGIVDDLLVWRWGEESFWVLPNASTHDRVLALFASQAAQAVATDLRSRTAMLAIQGPEAPARIEALLGVAPKRYRTYQVDYAGAKVMLAGTGYTGERGGEVVTDPATAEQLIRALMKLGAIACGLGARDTLRLEAGLLLAGQDFDQSNNPLEAGLEFAVAWDHDFVGRGALEQVKENGPEQRLTAFTLAGRKIPRHGYPLRARGSVGTVTSGNYSPMLSCGIGLGYLRPPAPGIDPEVEIRGVWEPAKATELPFLRK
jgi:aminomethyltransferase